MLKTLDNTFGQIGNVFVIFVNFITDQRSDDFIISFAAIEQTKTADWFRL